MLCNSLLAAAAALPLQAPSISISGETSVAVGAMVQPDAALLHALDDALFLDEPGDGRTWARGATYKASFGAEGFTYRPFLGSDAPRSFPLAIDLQSVTIAGDALDLTPRTRSRADRTVVLDRSAVREVYLLRERQVEQTFVLDDLPHRAEIVLTLAVDTDLVCSTEGDGFAFTAANGGVAYGGATAIDARGARLPLQQRWTGDGIEIVVPAEFVASAELPLTVDPIVSTFGVTDNARRQSDVDVAYDGRNSIYQIVWSQFESALDQDVFCVFYNVGVGALVGETSLDITSANWTRPRVASRYDDERFLCVSVVGTSTGNRRVWGRIREADTGVRGPQFTISGFGAEHADVGGNSIVFGNPILSSFFVVWQEADLLNQDFDIVGQVVGSSGTLYFGRVVIAGDPDDMDRFPSISRTTGRPDMNSNGHRYMIAWEREVGPDDRNIRCQVVDISGDATGFPQFNAYTFSDSRRPDVSVQDDELSFDGEPYWTIVFERRTGADYDVFGLVARDDGAYNARNLPVMQDLDQDLEQLRPKIAFDGQDYLLAYRTPVTASEDRLYFTALNVTREDGELRLGAALRRETVATSVDDEIEFGIATNYDGGSMGVQSVALLPYTAAPPNGDADVEAAFVGEFGPNVNGSQFCDANPNSTGVSAWMFTNGAVSMNPTRPLHLTCIDMPQDSFGHFLCSTQSGFVPNPAGSAGNLCLQGAIGRFNCAGEVLNSGAEGTFTLTTDPMAFPSPTGTVSAVSGQRWFFQTWFRDFGPTSNFSNGVRVWFE
ncbi:MAG: hypothetical protein AAGB93_22225 [Planctomycetota bacterium]